MQWPLQACNGVELTSHERSWLVHLFTSCCLFSLRATRILHLSLSALGSLLVGLGLSSWPRSCERERTIDLQSTQTRRPCPQEPVMFFGITPNAGPILMVPPLFCLGPVQRTITRSRGSAPLLFFNSGCGDCRCGIRAAPNESLMVLFYLYYICCQLSKNLTSYFN